MADLKETLSQRERRSRTVAFVVGVAIVLVLIFLIAQVNNDQTATEQQENGTEVTQIEGSEEGTETENGTNDGTSSEESVAGGESEQATQEDETTNGNNVNEEASGVVLPAAGPAENAAIGLAAVSIAGYIFAKSQRRLKATQLNS